MRRLSLFLLLCALSGAANADIVPPEVSSCGGKKAGDPCDFTAEGKGVCQDATCSKLDYSQGSPPKGTIEYPCVKCAPAPANVTPTNTTAPAKVNPPAKTKGCSVDPMGDAGSLALLSVFGVLLLRRRKAA